jgi:hypothetical protein
MNVVEGLRIWRKCEAAQIAPRKYVGQSLARLNIQQLKYSRALSPLLNLIKQQAAIGRNPKRFYCGVWSCAPKRRIDENLIRSVTALAETNAGLLLPHDAFSEEISATNLLQRVIRFNVEQLTNAFSDALPVWNGIEIGPRVLRLGRNPLASAWGLLVFEPAIGIGHWHAVQDFGDVFDL